MIVFNAQIFYLKMIVKHITTIVGASSFFFGIWLDKKYREYIASHKVPLFKIFDAVNADSIVPSNSQLIVNNEQRISQVRYTYITF